MGQNPSKRSKNQDYPMGNPAFYPPAPVLPYQSHYPYAQPGMGHHIITPYPMMVAEAPHRRRKTRRKSGGTRRRAGTSRKPVPAIVSRPSSRAGGTTALRVTNSTAGDQEDDEEPDTGPSTLQPAGGHTPGPERYIPPQPDMDPPINSFGPYVPFEEGRGTQPVVPGQRTPYPPHTAPSSMQFTPHTRALRNFPVDSSDEDDDEEPPVVPLQSRSRSHGRSRAGSASGHGHSGAIRRVATPGLALTRRVTTGTVVEFRSNPLPRPPENVTRATPYRRLRELDLSSSTGHDTRPSSHGHAGGSSSHGHGTSIGHGNVGTGSHGHDRTRSLDANHPAHIDVQPPAQPAHDSQHHRSKTVGSFFRRGGIGAGVGTVGGGIWRRVSQRRRNPNRQRVDLSEDDYVEVEPPTPAPALAPPGVGTITPYTLTAADTRTPQPSRPVTPVAPPPVLPLDTDASSAVIPPPPLLDTAPGPGMTPRSTRTMTPGPGMLGLSQSSRPVTPIGISGTATPGISTPALGLMQPPPEFGAQPSVASTSQIPTGPAPSNYDHTSTTRPSSYAPPFQPPPPPSAQPQYSTAAPPVIFNQSQPPLNAFLNHSQFRVIYTNSIARNQPAIPLTYPTAAHLFEALKFLPNNPEHASAIRTAPTVADVYRLSSQWEAEVRPDWGSMFLSRMEDVLLLKFRQHHQLRALLFSTGVTGAVGPDDRKGRELVYEDERDKFWGRGLDGVGRNELGKALMRVRERLITEGYASAINPNLTA
ncbi:hypothetical protein V5O48_000519 [Marasmius crinis-equi]|uniref:NADAR domain-containing protein n=1 Tax=Marasmius crinis-equi TaxID=585013 RepID=A0ABR3G0W5_9AGAR